MSSLTDFYALFLVKLQSH